MSIYHGASKVNTQFSVKLKYLCRSGVKSSRPDCKK